MNLITFCSTIVGSINRVDVALRPLQRMGLVVLNIRAHVQLTIIKLNEIFSRI